MEKPDSTSTAWYGTALICANGHVLTDELERLPAKNARFCPECGEGTLTTCPECDAPVRGRYHEPPLTCPPLRTPPSFCHDCGEPYPWTRETLQAAADLIDRIKRLSQEERAALKTELGEIMTDNPRTKIAALEVKQALGKAGRIIGPLLRDAVAGLATEAARRIIFPDPATRL